MNLDLLDLLCCPGCRGVLSLDAGSLRCTNCGAVYPVVDGVPRFVPAENYASSFGFQWNRFPRTQLDSHSGVPISRNRFFEQSAWSAEELRGKRVLDVGCGSGRFAEIALSTGARVVAIDYSAAVDAVRANLGANASLDVVQADVYRLPFRDEAFDYVYSFGVLQHTPDPARAFRSLLPPLRRGGKIAVDIYPKTWMNVLWPKYWLRPLTKRLPGQQLFRLVERLVPVLLPLSRLLGRVPVLGRKLRWFIPVANYEGIYPLNDAQIREWAVLDTFDMLSPAHDHPQLRATLRRWLDDAGVRDGEVLKTGHLVARGVRN
jgi:SAM-dependent methyltransferase